MGLKFSLSVFIRVCNVNLSNAIVTEPRKCESTYMDNPMRKFARHKRAVIAETFSYPVDFCNPVITFC